MRGESIGNDYQLPGKSRDRFELKEALPGYGGSFLGGPLLDILLWFTDYHHFHAPVTGRVIHHGQYEGSYNYDFDNYDPNADFILFPARTATLRALARDPGWIRLYDDGTYVIRAVPDGEMNTVMAGDPDAGGAGGGGEG